MTEKEVIFIMSRILNANFWDFRCYFMHHPGSITVDLDFFKLAKNSEIIFGGPNIGIGVGMFSFKNLELNKSLKCKTIEEYTYKELVLRFFFLRKEFIRIKRGDNTCEDISRYLELFFGAGISRGRIDELEALKRHAEYNQSNERGIKIQNVFSLPIGGTLGGTFSIARRFRPNKKSSRQDALGRILEEVVKEYFYKHRRLPEYSEVVKCLRNLAKSGHDVISKVNKSQIFWCREKGKLPETVAIGALQERLTRIRKKYKSIGKNIPLQPVRAE